MLFVVLRQQYRKQAEIIGLFAKLADAVKAREASFCEVKTYTVAPACWIEQKGIRL